MRVLLSTLPLSRGVAARARRTSARALRRGAVAAKSAERGLRVYAIAQMGHTHDPYARSAAPGPLRTRAGRLPAVGVAAAAVRPCAGS